MSLASDLNEMRRKRLKEIEKSPVKPLLFSEHDISPVGETNLAPVKSTGTTPKKDENTWFQSGAFEDGYQFGDILKSVGSTVGDAALGVGKGILKLGEGITDLALYGASEVAGIFDDDAEKTVKGWAKHNTIDAITKPLDDAVDKNSFLGNRMEAVEEGLGQVAGIILTGGLAGAAGLGSLGATALTTAVTGASSFGSGIGEALEGGATDGEAWGYGALSGVIDAGTELIFGGLGKAVNAVGLSKGISSLDDAFAKKLSSKISNQFWKNATEFGVKAGAEGAEEVLAGIGSAVAKNITYMSEEELGQLIKDEQLLDQFIVGAVTSGIAQSGYVPGMKNGSLREANATGRDFITGLTANEQKVVDKEVENRIKEAKENGEKVDKKAESKIREAVEEELKNGEISIDTIEDVLGSDLDSYKAYKDTIDGDNAAIEELKELYGDKAVDAEFASRVAEAEQNGQKLTSKQKENLRAEIAAEKQQQFRAEVESIYENSQRGEARKTLNEDLKQMLTRTNGKNTQSDSYLLESYAEVARRGQKFEADVNEYKNENARKTVQNILDSGVANNTNRMHRLANTLAKISADKGIIFSATDAKRLSETSFGVNGKTVNGFVTKDGITINFDSPKYLNSVVGHEISHVLEQNKDLYKLLQDAAFEYAKGRKSSTGKFENEYMERLFNARQLYKDVDGYKGAQGHDAIKKEVVSDLVGDYLFTDSKFIQNLSVKDRNLFQKIFDEIKYLCKIATAGSKEKRDLERVKKAFEDAYRADTKTQKNTADESGVKSDTNYSLSYTTENNPVAVIEKDIFDGKYDELTDSERIKIVKNAIKGFRPGIPVSGRLIGVSRKSAGHFTNSDYTDKIRNNAPLVYKDKLNIAQNIDDVVYASTNYINEAPKHPRNDNITDFARGRVLLTIGGNKYAANVLVGYTVEQEMVLYDVQDFTPTDFEIKEKKAHPKLSENESRNRRTDVPSDDIVPQKEENVKRKFSLSPEQQKADNDYLDAVNRGDTETAQKMVDEAAEKAGYSVKAYHGSRHGGFTVFDDTKNDLAQKGFFFSSSPDVAKSYMKGSGGSIYTEYIQMNNPLVVEGHRRNWDSLKFDIGDDAKSYKAVQRKDGRWEIHTVEGRVNIENQVAWATKEDAIQAYKGAPYIHPTKTVLNTTRDIVRYAYNKGVYDGVIIKDTVDMGDSRAKRKISTLYIPFESNQIKSADAITYDDNGNVIPLSQRFNAENNDIRYSLSAEGETPNTYGDLHVRGEDVKYVPMQEDIAPVKEDAAPAQNVAVNAPEEGEMFPDDLAPMTEEEANAMQGERLDTLTDADAPPEMEAPYYGEGETLTADDPFANRDMKEVSRDRKTNAYMYENPEVKPFFQAEARTLLWELEQTEKPQTYYNGWMKYEMSFEAAQDIPEIYRTPRVTSPDIAYLRDTVKMSYADIEKGIKAIIEDNGAENIAAAKKIEFILNDRLLNGSEDMDGFKNPPNQDYINLINEKQISEYSEEARKQFFEVADDYAPAEDIAPVAEQYEAVKPKPSNEPRMARADEDIAPTYETKRKDQLDGQRTMFPEGKVAEVLTEEPDAKQKDRTLSKARMLVLDKQSPIEDLALKTKNRELMGKANYMLSSESRAQTFMGEGRNGVKALTELRAEVENAGLEKDFSDYMYHKHNVDRMSLESKAQATLAKLQSKFGHLEIKQMYAIANTEITDKTTERTAQTIREAKEYLNALEAKNKPVFGDSITAEVSQQRVAEFEKAHPEFKRWAKDVYGINEHLRKMLVDAGVISQETADLWATMYPNYVPIRRADKNGAAVNVPLDTGRTGVNAPIKRATGGNSDILPMFNTLATRIEQTFKAVARNNFGVELKNTLGAEGINQKATLDEVLDNIDTHEELLKKGENGANPTFTVFENGERVEFEITEDLYDALKPNTMTGEIKPLSFASKVQRGLLTEYNPAFMATNAIKDVQDVLLNSQHAAKTYANMPLAIKELFTKGKWYQEYMENGGGDNTYFDNQKKTFTKEDTGLKKLLGIPFRGISAANNFIERMPRLAEYIASRKGGASVEVAMLDAARVTTNFAAGGDLTKWANRNGFTFLNASVQGFNQQVRNFREAKAKGLGGVMTLAAKFAVAGLSVALLNRILWEDDEEYEELSDYVKDSYYIVGKTDDGTFIRIPKGRALAVIQSGFEQMGNLITGDDEVDMARFGQLLVENLAPNNPLDNNVIAPIKQVAENKTWYGEDLVPQRLQDLPDAEQYDESTDSISKWLGEKLDVSPYKINYLLDQYSGGIGDVFLPMLTPEAENGDSNLFAPMRDKFTTDSVMKNQNVSDFYDTVDELAKNANSMHATDEDALKYKYMNSVSADLSDLYQQKREIQNSNLSDKAKYNAVREVQRQIDELSKEALNTYNNVSVDGVYATVGDRHYRWYEPGEDSDAEAGWQKISGKQLEKQENVTSKLGISASQYWSNKEEYDYAYDYPEKYAVAKSAGGYKSFRQYSSELYDIKADKDKNGKSISGSRKEKVLKYINALDADYGTKIILFKSEYNADDTYNYDIIEYLNGRNDISYEEMATILKELGFTVHSNGRVTW